MTKMDIDNFEQINSPEEFLLFLKWLAQDYQINGHHWENTTIDSYLESIAAWCEDSRFLENHDHHWKEKPLTCIAELFHAGKYYE